MNSHNINLRNVNNVRYQINKKKDQYPYHATIDTAAEVLTDHDTFPYPRWWRGVPFSSHPVVAEREAGWRPRHDDCYQVNEVPRPNIKYPNHCWETACSTVFPCYPEYLQKYSDRDALNVMLNKACTVQYR